MPTVPTLTTLERVRRVVRARRAEIEGMGIDLRTFDFHLLVEKRPVRRSRPRRRAARPITV